MECGSCGLSAILKSGTRHGTRHEAQDEAQDEAHHETRCEPRREPYSPTRVPFDYRSQHKNMSSANSTAKS